MITKDEFEKSLEERQTKAIRDRLKKGKVAIAGLGGLGSNIALMLARTGIQKMMLADFDTVDISNLNRQAYTIEHIGMKKTEAMERLIRQVNPWIELEFYQGKITGENAAGLFQNYPIVCEAFDDPQAKAELATAVLEKLPKTYILSGNGMAGTYSSNLIQTKKMMKRLYICGDEKHGISKEESLTSARVSICAGHEANMAVRLILGETEV